MNLKNASPFAHLYCLPGMVLWGGRRDTSPPPPPSQDKNASNSIATFFVCVRFSVSSPLSTGIQRQAVAGFLFSHQKAKRKAVAHQRALFSLPSRPLPFSRSAPQQMKRQGCWPCIIVKNSQHTMGGLHIYNYLYTQREIKALKFHLGLGEGVTAMRRRKRRQATFPPFLPQITAGSLSQFGN